MTMMTHAERADRIDAMMTQVRQTYKSHARTIEQVRHMMLDIEQSLKAGVAPSHVKVQASLNQATSALLEVYAAIGREHAIKYTTGVL